MYFNIKHYLKTINQLNIIHLLHKHNAFKKGKNFLLYLHSVIRIHKITLSLL